jgi:hypothetical protein
LSNVPELQKSEDEQSKRDIEEITAGLKTINDVLSERGKPLKAGAIPGISRGTSFPLIAVILIREELKNESAEGLNGRI